MKRNGWILAIVAVSLAWAAPAAADWQNEGPWLGTVESLVIDPSNPATLYAGTYDGGVWKSTDSGASWQHAGLPGNVILSIHFDPNDSNSLFAVSDGGLHKSEDAGASWKRLGVPRLRGHVGALAIAPSDPTRMLLPNGNELHRSDDGGATWELARIMGMDVHSFAFDPKDAQTVYAAGSGGKGACFRRSSDGGVSWDRIGAGLEGVAKATGIAVTPDGALFMVGYRGLYTSSDRGENWVPLGGDVSGAEFSMLTLGHGSPPTLFATIKKKGLFRSSDGGRSWTEIDKGIRNPVRALAIHSGNREVLYAGNSRGIYKSTDAGQSWQTVNGGLAAAWVSELAAGADGVLFIKLSQGFYRREPGGEWQRPESLEKRVKAHDILPDRHRPGTVHLAGESNYRRSSDAGKTWEDPHKEDPKAFKKLRKLSKEEKKLMEEFPPSFHSLAQDPTEADVLYAGAPRYSGSRAALFRTTDGGMLWLPWGEGLPEDGVKLLHAATSTTLYAVTGRDQLYRSQDAGKSWTVAGGGLPQEEIRDLASDPETPTRVYAATAEGLFVSSDSGQSWSASNEGIAHKSLRAIVPVPGHGIFLSGFRGVFRSMDQGKTWTALNDGLTHINVRSLAVSGGDSPTLYAGTAGGSVFSIAVP